MIKYDIDLYTLKIVALFLMGFASLVMLWDAPQFDTFYGHIAWFLYNLTVTLVVIWEVSHLIFGYECVENEDDEGDEAK